MVLYLGHYANWEFVPAIVRHFHVPQICAQVYKPLHDKAFDRIMLKVRSRFNPVSIPQARVFRTLVGWARDKVPFICGFIADHRSNERVSHHEMTFLNQRTQFNPGGEEIGKRINAAYLYLDVEKPRRGHYKFTFKPIVPLIPRRTHPIPASISGCSSRPYAAAPGCGCGRTAGGSGPPPPHRHPRQTNPETKHRIYPKNEDYMRNSGTRRVDTFF